MAMPLEVSCAVPSNLDPLLKFTSPGVTSVAADLTVAVSVYIVCPIDERSGRRLERSRSWRCCLQNGAGTNSEEVRAHE